MSNSLQEKIHEFLESTSRFLNELRHLQLFKREELVSVHKKRKSFEYATYSTQVKKDVFLKYLTFELNFLELIKIRQTRSGIQRVRYFFEELKYIKSIFKRCLYRFPKDTIMWKSYIDFCIEYNFEVEECLDLAIQKNPMNADLYIISAKYHYEVSLQPELSLEILENATRLIRNNKNLYLQLLKLVLLQSLPDLEVVADHFDQTKRKKKEEEVMRDEDEDEDEDEEEEDGDNLSFNTNIFDEKTRKRNDLTTNEDERYSKAIRILEEDILKSSTTEVSDDYSFQLQTLKIFTEFPLTENIIRRNFTKIFTKFINVADGLLKCHQFLYSYNHKIHTQDLSISSSKRQNTEKNNESEFGYFKLIKHVCESYFEKVVQYRSSENFRLFSRFITWIYREFKKHQNDLILQNEDDESSSEEEEEIEGENNEKQETNKQNNESFQRNQEMEDRKVCEYLYDLMIVKLYNLANNESKITEELMISIIHSSSTIFRNIDNDSLEFCVRAITLFPNSGYIFISYLKNFVRFQANQTQTQTNSQIIEKINQLVNEVVDGRKKFSNYMNEVWYSILEYLILFQGNNTEFIKKSFHNSIYFYQQNIVNVNQRSNQRMNDEEENVVVTQISNQRNHYLVKRKMLYFKWTIMNSFSFSETLEIISEIIRTTPNSFELYESVISFLQDKLTILSFENDQQQRQEQEQEESEQKMKNIMGFIRKVFGSAIREFGETEYRVWILFVDFVKDVDVNEVEKVYQNALNTLNNDQRELFLINYM